MSIMMTLYICFYFIILSVIFFLLHFLAMLRACEILVPHPGIELMLPALEAQSPNHWTAKEVPQWILIPCSYKDGERP